MSRIWIMVSALLSIGILALGWFIGIAPKLNEMSAANDQRETVEAQNQLHELRLATLKADFERIDELREELAAIHVQLPPGDDLSTFVGLLDQLETASGATITQISVADAMPYIAAPQAIKTSERVTRTNFIVIPVTMAIKGTRAQVLNFVSTLQFGEEQRLYLVQNFTLAQEGTQETESGYTGNLQGYVYVLVDPSAPPPAPTPPEPTQAPTNTEG